MNTIELLKFRVRATLVTELAGSLYAARVGGTERRMFLAQEAQLWNSTWPRIYAIEGMEKAAGQQLLAELMDAATAPGLSDVHTWRNGDVASGTIATMHRGWPWPARFLDLTPAVLRRDRRNRCVLKNASASAR